MSWIEEKDVHPSPVINVLSINNSAMESVDNLAGAVIRGQSCLTRVQEEAISTVVSATNHCRYLTLSHGGYLRQRSDDPEFASQIIFDYAQADLDPKTRGMLDFAVKLTRDPSGNKKVDVEQLREIGLRRPRDSGHGSGDLLLQLYEPPGRRLERGNSRESVRGPQALAVS